MSISNDSRFPGKLAGEKEFFGEHRRFAIAPVNTRLDAVMWFVWDAERIDPDTGFAAIIRQDFSREKALTGLN